MKTDKMRIRMYHCGNTILVVFTEGAQVLFSVRFTRRGAIQVVARLQRVFLQSLLPRHTCS